MTQNYSDSWTLFPTSTVTVAPRWTSRFTPLHFLFATCHLFTPMKPIFPLSFNKSLSKTKAHNLTSTEGWLLLIKESNTSPGCCQSIAARSICSKLPTLVKPVMPASPWFADGWRIVKKVKAATTTPPLELLNHHHNLQSPHTQKTFRLCIGFKIFKSRIFWNQRHN